MNAMELETVQAVAFKVLVDALKDLLTDTIIEFDSDGVRIAATDVSACVLVHLRLDASKFERYHCARPLSLGLNVIHLSKLLKTVTSSDTLGLFVDEADINRLGIRVENSEKKTRTTYHLNLLDLAHEPISIDRASFDVTITLPAPDFSKMVRDMSSIAEHVEVRAVGRQIVFKCSGDFASQETVVADSGTPAEQPGADAIVQGVYSLKCLCTFAKCTALSPSVDLLMRNDFPLVVRYSVASLGEIKLCLAHVTGVGDA